MKQKCIIRVFFTNDTGMEPYCFDIWGTPSRMRNIFNQWVQGNLPSQVVTDNFAFVAKNIIAMVFQDSCDEGDEWKYLNEDEE